MVKDFDRAGHGRAAGGAARLNFDNALEGLKEAPLWRLVPVSC